MPDKSPSVLQVWKRHNLGADWTVSFLSDGSASFHNGRTQEQLRLPAYSVDTLRKIVRREAIETTT